MSEVSTASIFTYDSQKKLSTRPGDVRLDPAEALSPNGDGRDALRPLHVTGLNEDDIFVFLDVEQSNIGYIVGLIDNSDNTGVIVPGDLVEADPRTHLSQEVSRRLYDMDYPTLAEFGLQGLAREIYRRANS